MVCSCECGNEFLDSIKYGKRFEQPRTYYLVANQELNFSQNGNLNLCATFRENVNCIITHIIKKKFIFIQSVFYSVSIYIKSPFYSISISIQFPFLFNLYFYSVYLHSISIFIQCLFLFNLRFIQSLFIFNLYFI